MGFAEFIENRFMNKEICVYCSEEGETLLFAESWASNKAFFRGMVKEIENNILALEISKVGILYINCDDITNIWEPSFDFHKAMRTSLTSRMVGAKSKDR